MIPSNLKISLLIGLSLLIGMILSIMPLPESIAWCRPEWVFMILFFWIMMAPNRVGVLTAFFVGLLMDLLSGTILGLHAMLFSLTAFFVSHFYVQIHGLPIWQRTLMFFAILIACFGLQNWVFSLTGLPTHFWHYLVPAIISAILWPWVYLLLRDFQQRYEIG